MRAETGRGSGVVGAGAAFEVRVEGGVEMGGDGTREEGGDGAMEMVNGG
jgi:hypothetical protein